MNPEKLQMQNLLFMKVPDVANQHVPNCHDFVIYIFKKNSSMRVKRYYQCRCDVSGAEDDGENRDGSREDTQQHPLFQAHPETRRIKPPCPSPSAPKTPDFHNALQLAKTGKLGCVPAILFSTENNRKACGKLFSSLSKFFAHLRVHSNEKPFVCPVEGCDADFNQKGNMLQHVERIHPKFSKSQKQPV